MTLKELCDPSVIKELTRMKALGASYREIREVIRDEFGITATENTLSNLYKQVSKSSTDVLKTDDEMRSIIKSEVLDTAKQLKDINEKMYALFDELKDKETANKVTDMVQVSREIRNQLEFQAKLLHKITDSGPVTHINYIDQSIKVINIVKDLEKEGYIKILKDLPNHGGV